MAWEKQQRMNGPGVWAPATHMGNLDEAPGSWLQLGPSLAILAVWGVDQRMKELSLSLYFSNK